MRGNYALQPEEAVRLILVHLKQIAEASLGEEADRAVIAAPASFSFNAVGLMATAAERAGFKNVRIIHVPVAAVLAYCAGDARDRLRMLVYNLGGGSFEVGLVEKRDGVLDLIAADGERFLGGCDFDRSLALWIAEKLKAQGYDMQLDPDEPSDSAILARLMTCAERAKIRLSSSSRCAIVESGTGILDRSGEPVCVDLDITVTGYATSKLPWRHFILPTPTALPPDKNFQPQRRGEAVNELPEERRSQKPGVRRRTLQSIGM